jgi:nitric oxide reductase subunit B
MGVGYLDTQLKLQPHFLMLTATGILFTAGVGAFIWDFFRQVPIRDPMMESSADALPSPSAA